MNRLEFPVYPYISASRRLSEREQTQNQDVNANFLTLSSKHYRIQPHWRSNSSLLNFNRNHKVHTDFHSIPFHVYRTRPIEFHTVYSIYRSIHLAPTDWSLELAHTVLPDFLSRDWCASFGVLSNPVNNLLFRISITKRTVMHQIAGRYQIACPKTSDTRKIWPW
jgi:hypothetical protein